MERRKSGRGNIGVRMCMHYRERERGTYVYVYYIQREKMLEGWGDVCTERFMFGETVVLRF